MEKSFRIVIVVGLSFFILACDPSRKSTTEVAFVNKNELASEVLGLSAKKIKNDVKLLPEVLQRKLMSDSSSREKYIKGLYAEDKLERVIEEKYASELKGILNRVKGYRNQLYLDLMVKREIESQKEDFMVLAKDKYYSDKKSYMTRKKIRIAQIYISKYGRTRAEALSKIEEVNNALKKDESSFFKLAEKYSEDKENATKGGVYEKWIIAPNKLAKLNKVLIAAFNLKSVSNRSDIIETKQGFHIVKLIDLSPSILKSFDKVSTKIISALKAEYAQNIKAEVKQRLRVGDDKPYKDAELLKIIKKGVLLEDVQ